MAVNPSRSPLYYKAQRLTIFCLFGLKVFCGLERNGWRGRHSDIVSESFRNIYLANPETILKKTLCMRSLTRIMCVDAQRERLHALKHTQNIFYGIRPLPSQIPFQRTTTGLSENKASCRPHMYFFLRIKYVGQLKIITMF